MKRSLGPNIAIAALAGALAWGMAWYWEKRFGHARLEDQLGAVFVPATSAATLYAVLAVLLRIPAAREAATLLWRKVNKWFAS